MKKPLTYNLLRQSALQAYSNLQKNGLFCWLNRPGSGIPQAWEEINYDALYDCYVLSSRSGKVTLTACREGFRFRADQAKHLAPRYFEGLPIKPVLHDSGGTHLYNPTGIAKIFRAGTTHLRFAKATAGEATSLAIPADKCELVPNSLAYRTGSVAVSCDYKGNAKTITPRRDALRDCPSRISYGNVYDCLVRSYYRNEELLKQAHPRVLDALDYMYRFEGSNERVYLCGIFSTGRADDPGYAARFILADDRVDGQRIVIHAVLNNYKHDMVWLEVLDSEGQIKREAPEGIDSEFHRVSVDEWMNRAFGYMDECSVMDVLPIV